MLTIAEIRKQYADLDGYLGAVGPLLDALDAARALVERSFEQGYQYGAENGYHQGHYGKSLDDAWAGSSIREELEATQ